MNLKFNSKKIVLGGFIFIITFLISLFIVEKIENRLEIKKIETERSSVIIEAKKNTIKSANKTAQKPPENTEITKLENLIKKEIPKTAYLEVQFLCQAPLETPENWKYHEESCEEAALLQTYLFETGTTISKQDAHFKILEMIDWQKKNMGGHRDLYADDMKKFAMGFYGLQENEIKIIKDASIEDIKREVANGHPVIVPITGDILNNPYYPYPGYHMLAVIGYTEKKIITNDNGTKRGKDFSYDTEIFEAAMKDAGGDILILRKL